MAFQKFPRATPGKLLTYKKCMEIVSIGKSMNKQLINIQHQLELLKTLGKIYLLSWKIDFSISLPVRSQGKSLVDAYKLRYIIDD